MAAAIDLCLFRPWRNVLFLEQDAAPNQAARAPHNEKVTTTDRSLPATTQTARAACRMGPRKKGANIKSTGATSSKAAPLPDWVKNKNASKPPPAPAPVRARNTPPLGKDALASGGGAPAPGPPQHLFPVGSKPPLNLLTEKIAAHTRKASGKEAAWLKPVIDVRRIASGQVSAWAEAQTQMLHAERSRRAEALEKQPKRKPKKGAEPEPPPEAYGSDDLATALVYAEEMPDALPSGFSPATQAAAFGVDVGGVLEAYLAASQADDGSTPEGEEDIIVNADEVEGAKKIPAAWTATVTLTRESKGHGVAADAVKMSPDDRLHPELRIYAISAQHARQWAATYALFRLFTQMPMHRMLPPGPREYWRVCEAFQSKWAVKERELARAKNSPQNAAGREAKRRAQLLAYYWDSDPFASATRRQAAATAAEQSRSTASALQTAIQHGDHEAAEKLAAQQQRERREHQQALAMGKLGPATASADATALQAAQKAKEARRSVWDEAPTLHVPMANRRLLEDAINNGFAHFPSASAEAVDDKGKESKGQTTPPTDPIKLGTHLEKLGFRPGYARSAAQWVAAARQRLASGQARDTLDRAALATLAEQSDEHAGLEYLLMYTPPEDLPPKFAYKHTQRGKAPDEFVSGGAAGQGGELDIGMRWLVERVSGAVGAPLTAVERAAHRLLRFENDHPDAWDREDRQGVLVDMLIAALVHGEPDRNGGSLSQEQAMQAARSVPKDQSSAQSEQLVQEKEILSSILGDDRINDVTLKDWPLPSGSAEIGAFQAIDIRIPRAGDDVRLRLAPHPVSGYGILSEPQLVVRPTAFVVSSTLPSYICLALTRLVQTPIPEGEDDLVSAVEAGSGATMLLVERLEAKLDKLVDHPPPLSDVLRPFVDSPEPRRITAPIDGGAPAARKTSKKREGKTELPPAAAEELTQRARADRTAWEADKSYTSNYGRVRHSLPAWASRQAFLDLLRQAPGRVILTAGETGCGKTTQCPQFILDEAIANGSLADTNIVVTQPRRVAAVAVAQRVAAERGESLGGDKNKYAMTGYAIRGERKASPNCRLLFCTTGVLLRRLTGSGLRGISHVVVDEVHERSVDSDVLLLHLRTALKTNPQLKVVLMSATVEQETFVRYFNGCPTLTIPGRTFPVNDLYLEDIFRLTSYDPSGSTQVRGKSKSLSEAQKGEIAGFTAKHAEPLSEAQMRSLITLISRTQETTDYDLLARTVLLALERSVNAAAEGAEGGAILVFVSGVGEIRSASEAIERIVGQAGRKATVLPLHANLSPQEQRLAFEGTRHTKVVVATNVAETSITIPDISYVVDSGKVKENRWDANLGLSRLEEVWASRAAARQRRGRAGRVRAGECYRLYSRYTEQTVMPSNQTPEMLRTPLHNLILSVLATESAVLKEQMKSSSQATSDVKAFLLQALSPPRIENIDSALRDLVDAGALQPAVGSAPHGALTALGRHLASLPLDLRLGKILVLGGLFGCLGPALTIAALMTCKPIFVAPFEKRDEANRYAYPRLVSAAAADFFEHKGPPQVHTGK